MNEYLFNFEEWHVSIPRNKTTIRSTTCMYICSSRAGGMTNTHTHTNPFLSREGSTLIEIICWDCLPASIVQSVLDRVHRSEVVMAVQHPYYPLHLEIPSYLANQWDTLTLVSLFASGCTVIFLVTYLLVMRVQPKITNGDLLTVMWFVLCMLISKGPNSSQWR